MGYVTSKGKEGEKKEKGGEESGKGMGRKGKDDTETGPPVA